MQVSDDFLDQWEHIIAGVNKTDVPLECIKKVVIKLAGNRQKTINLHLMLKQGLAPVSYTHLTLPTSDLV